MRVNKENKAKIVIYIRTWLFRIDRLAHNKFRWSVKCVDTLKPIYLA